MHLLEYEIVERQNHRISQLLIKFHVLQNLIELSTEAIAFKWCEVEHDFTILTL